MIKVLVSGCFDILHIGHVKFLKAAKNAGDYLVVLLESDEKVKKLKGPNRPIHNQSQRAEMLESLKMVDEVIKLPTITTYEQYLTVVKKIKPDIIAITSGDPNWEIKKRMAKEVGGKVEVVITRINKYSTSSISKL